MNIDVIMRRWIDILARLWLGWQERRRARHWMRSRRRDGSEWMLEDAEESDETDVRGGVSAA